MKAMWLVVAMMAGCAWTNQQTTAARSQAQAPVESQEDAERRALAAKDLEVKQQCEPVYAQVAATTAPPADFVPDSPADAQTAAAVRLETLRVLQLKVAVCHDLAAAALAARESFDARAGARRAAAEADYAASMTRMRTLSAALQGTGQAMQNAYAPRPTVQTHCTPDGLGGVRCTSY